MTKKARIIYSVVVGFSALYNFTLPLHPDEAYYWVWSRNLQLSYFDHPPMVAYLIKMMTLLGQHEFVIRLVSVFCVAGAAYLVYRLAEDMFNSRVAEISLGVFLFMPLVQSGFIVVTPDSPLVFFWTLTFYCFYNYVFREKRKYIYLAGIAAGMLLLSKYTGVLLLGSLFFYLTFSKKRKLFKRPELYAAGVLALLVFLPVIIWNYQHGWASFKFQFSHGVADKKVFNPSALGEFIASQVMVFNPVFATGFLILFIKNIKDVIKNKYLYLLTWPFAFTLLFFVYNSAFKKAEANWAGPAYITAAIILAYWIDKHKLKKFFIAGLIMAIFLIIVMRFPEFIPGYPEQAVLKKDFYGHNFIYSEASQYLGPGIILSDSYQNASEAQFYLKGRPEVYIITQTRYSNYNLWSKEVKENIENGEIKEAIYIGASDKKDELLTYFDDVYLLDRIKYNGRFVQRLFYVYRCYN
ncbi:ArnT family glycosyltransferase [Halothermothrix orenii]|uniref:Glycosyl transferase family 39 n=1 Tax=Halothermothrix orenii (strain H 168 / OCM 544 / DSM 9562) TaxID=373903 RepID=B8CZB2_HALOH|nr:glycosyltransferase family 39 protein [Halothermothrix orenii]ACL70631.1 glycosyl transferase family 39 [Halothermothrix orenii H 168]